MSELKVENVSYRYKNASRKALTDVCCTFGAGTVTAVVGPSGSGKTTLLSILAGLDRPEEGKILLNGQDLAGKDLDEYRRQDISIIFQAFQLFPLLTVIENVCYPLTHYGYDPAAAKRLLEEGGWVYNSQGEPYEEGVRYKRLTPEEADALDGVNKTYTSVANTDGILYQTVEIGGAYYLPLVINWLATEQSAVTDLLTLTMAVSPDVAAAGMVIRAVTTDPRTLRGHIYRDESMGYEGVPTYSLFNLATEWPDSVYDVSYQWSPDPAYAEFSSNRLYDAYDAAFPYDAAGERLTYAEAMEASGGKLGLDYLSMAMVHSAADEAEYNQWWKAYIKR